uniref:Uncharacterized protein n=1 Tax=Triticum urartu TaxID=4572 RepID=A0A8R7P2B7_TRIUA
MVLTWTLVLWNNLAGIGSYRIIELAGSENHGVGVSAYQTLTRLAVRHRPSRPPRHLPPRPPPQLQPWLPPHLQPRPPPPRPTAVAPRANDPFPRHHATGPLRHELQRRPSRRCS